MTTLCSRQTNNKVHGDLIPFPYRNIHLLQQTRRPLMLCLHPLTNETSGNKLSNISLHACPPEELPQIPEHLGSTWMDSVPGYMSFCQQIIPELHIIRHT